MTPPDARGREPSAGAAGARRVPMRGSPNTREAGGYPAAGGAATRHGMLYRSGWFDLGDPENRALFARLGIRLVFDLRTGEDRARKPFDPAPLGAGLVPLPVEKGSMGRYLEAVAGMDSAEVDCKAAMTRMYAEMLDEAEESFASLFHGLAEADGPALVMCNSGKDRTGVAVALVLTALGVPKAAVFEDYMASAGIFAGREEAFARSHGYRERGISPDLVRDVMTVHPEYLEAAWARAEAISGSMENYIAERICGGRVDLAGLRKKFTQTPQVERKGRAATA